MAAPDPSVELMRMINGYQVSQALHVAAALGVADQLKDGQKSCDVMARACGRTRRRSIDCSELWLRPVYFTKPPTRSSL